jgi:signal transduction histidine kinase
LRRIIKTIVRAGRDSDAWPIALVLVAVLVPAVCLLWFMSAAMRNEHYAARQILADAWRVQLSASRARVEEHWNQTALQLQELSRGGPPPVAFARCIQSGLVDSVVLFDELGRTIYPNQPLAPAATDMGARWEEGSALEHRRRDFGAAAKVYDALARNATNINQRARALQAQARCLVHAGAKQDAIRLISELLGAEQYGRAVDQQGRLIVANAELMALELIEDPAAFQATALRLQQRLTDYENVALAAPQRRFLMKELRRISRAEFSTLAAEELAAAFYDRTLPADAWQLITPNRRVVALVSHDKLVHQLTTLVRDPRNDAEITVLPPGKENAAAFVSLELGNPFPGWRLAISPADSTRLNTMIKHRTAIYLWRGALLVAVMGGLTLLAVRVLRRQTALARLKNDLAATVSHELKTPLASMRVLADTLLNSNKLDEQTTREYLQLIAQQNERLSRLIHNFLTFSRIERDRHTFHFAPCSVAEIVAGAVEAMRERFQAAGCRFESHVAPDLPAVMADREAVTAALINLLDNSWKYSGDIKQISLAARVEKGKVVFSVQDNGIGIAPREHARIFRSFYQVDRKLSRSEGGCGLGLSIVQFIVAAHNGSVSVESEPGRGSTFTISLPAATTAASLQEAIA